MQAAAAEGGVMAEGLERHGAAVRTAASAATARPPHDAVQAILASAGVEYTHDNAEVVGSSRVEAQISARAEQVLAATDVLDGESGGGDYDHDGDSDADAQLARFGAAFAVAAVAAPGLPLSRGFCYNPPADVMQRQFCTMARDAGFASATDFAVAVEGWTPEERRGWLDRFYRRRMAMIGEGREVEGKGKEEAQGGQGDKEEAQGGQGDKEEAQGGQGDKEGGQGGQRGQGDKEEAQGGGQGGQGGHGGQVDKEGVKDVEAPVVFKRAAADRKQRQPPRPETPAPDAIVILSSSPIAVKEEATEANKDDDDETDEL